MTKSKLTVITSDESETSATISIGGDEYILADDDREFISSADTFSANEGISVYGKDGCEPWNVYWSGRIVSSRIFKVCSLLVLRYSAI